MYKKIFSGFALLCLVVFCVESVSGQSKKKETNDKKQSIYQETPSSRNPGVEVQTLEKSRKTASRGKTSSYLKHLDQKVEEYHQRMKDNEKKYKKLARISKKPQYSDPTYFGHKKKPKKRAPGKRKFCKECEIIH